MQAFLIVGSIVVALVLVRIWTGALNVKAVEEQSLATIEQRHPYLPHVQAILVSILLAGGLFFLSLKFGKTTSLKSFTESGALVRTLVVFGLISGFGLFDQWRWHGVKDRYKYYYAFVLGTLVTWILIAFKRALFETGIHQDPFLVALGITCIVIGWRFLFGPWSASIKATVLGAFIFWVAYAILRFENREQLIATGLAALVALIPVLVWCALFLSYHRQRLGVVFLAFFAGMLSTVPILFYSELVKRSMELNFFLFKVVPLSYGSSSRVFVTESIFRNVSSVQSVVLTTLVTYILVGVIEETSKFWVLRYSSKEFFRSIDDTLQLAIIVAIGFAFAENLVNPTYFVGFVRDFLMRPETPQWGQFIGNVVGRSVLTNMVHILSTGVLGYFFGLAFFASPLLRAQFARGEVHPLLRAIHQMISVRTEAVYAKTQMILGLLAAIALHGAFDFIVTLPDVLPGNPATVGAILGMETSSFLQGIPLTLVPAVLYVVGGLWLLMYLFERKEDMKEFGAIVETQTIVSE
jgi:hypothetical protein